MKQQERVKNSRELVMRAAMEEFGMNGFDNASINHFCELYSISKGRLYHHFKNKDEIFTACAQKCYGELCGALKGFLPDQEKGLEENLHDYFHARQQYFFEEPYAALLMYRIIQRPPEHLKEKLQPLRDEFRSVNESVLFRILEQMPRREGVSINMVIQIFHVASNYVHIVHGYPEWNPKGDVDKSVRDSLAAFDKVITVLLFGIIPRE